MRLKSDCGIIAYAVYIEPCDLREHGTIGVDFSKPIGQITSYKRHKTDPKFRWMPRIGSDTYPTREDADKRGSVFELILFKLADLFEAFTCTLSLDELRNLDRRYSVKVTYDVSGEPFVSFCHASNG